MLAEIQILDKNFQIDLSKPIDISMPLSNTDKNPIAWYLNKPVIEPVVFDDWIGKVSEGKSSTNFNNILFNPHGHGTHTECLGHITREFYSINDCLKQFFFIAKLISVEPQKIDNDLIITKENVLTAIGKTGNINQTNIAFEALIVRTLPNVNDKLSKKYSNTNPPYLSEEAAIYIREIGIKHLLIDLPSVDREHDNGKLLAHKAFWNVKNVDALNDDARLNCTISELIFVDNAIADGDYLLNLQIASFVNDASPSKPILYPLKSSQKE